MPNKPARGTAKPLRALSAPAGDVEAVEKYTTPIRFGISERPLFTSTSQRLCPPITSLPYDGQSGHLMGELTFEGLSISCYENDRPL
ncbi:hypothetical protein C0068_12670 [Zhongshania marina]|uniref:Uncharacterized protein n=1 Tax=Zhongshania marina TaxID=2304603 RepID=A0A2S4HEI4_9GAMM|nr:hypothetical protein C0068_12670 [Marortus luteolus]